jgi:hypothetical protein
LWIDCLKLLEVEQAREKCGEATRTGYCGGGDLTGLEEPDKGLSKKVMLDLGSDMLSLGDWGSLSSSSMQLGNSPWHQDGGKEGCLSAAGREREIVEGVMAQR